MAEENKIYVGSLAMETTSDSLRAHFSQFGEVTDCIVMPDKVTGRSRGFGFVSFKDSGAMNAALGTSNTVDGREVACKKAVRESPQTYVQDSGGVYNSVKVFVGGLPATCDYGKFTEYFGRFGQIEDAVVMMDNQSQRHLIRLCDLRRVNSCGGGAPKLLGQPDRWEVGRGETVHSSRQDGSRQGQRQADEW